MVARGLVSAQDYLNNKYDSYLKDFLHIIDDKNFRIATSYNQIIEETNYEQLE